MFETTKHYKNEFLVKSYSFDERVFRLTEIDPYRVFMERRFQLLHGSQEKIKSFKEEIDKVVYKTPATTFDWVKRLIIEFEPSLCFGWIVPQYKEFSVPQSIVTNEHYINVMPVPEQYKDRKVVAFRYFNLENVSLDPYVFLESEPPTKEDIKNAEDILLNAKQMSFYFARSFEK